MRCVTIDANGANGLEQRSRFNRLERRKAKNEAGAGYDADENANKGG